MKLRDYADSKTYFSLLDEVDDPGTSLIQARIFSAKIFLNLLLILPFGLCYKLGKTFLRVVALFLSGLLLFFTLGSANGIRELFVRRVSSIARDLADWALLPFAVVSCAIRLLLAALVYPPLFLRF